MRRRPIVFRAATEVATARRRNQPRTGFDRVELREELAHGRPRRIGLSTLHRGGSGCEEPLLEIVGAGLAALTRRRLNLAETASRDGAVSAFHGSTSATTNALPPVGLGRTPLVWTITPDP